VVCRLTAERLSEKNVALLEANERAATMRNEAKTSLDQAKGKLAQLESEKNGIAVRSPSM
jgi:hypothetical protein